MAIIDKNGNVRGLAGPAVSRRYRDLNVLQSKPSTFKNTVRSTLSALETGIASSAAKILRGLFSPINNQFDTSIHSRLSGAIKSSISRSQTAGLGTRDLYDGNLALIKNFQFNKFSPFEKILTAKPIAEMLPDGQIRLSIPAITDYKDLKHPGTHRHVFLRFLCIAIHFRENQSRYLACKDFVIPKGGKLQEQECFIDGKVPEGCLIFLTFSLHWQINHEFTGAHIINTKEFSPAEILGVWQAPNQSNEANDTGFRNDNIEGPEYFWRELTAYRGNDKLKQAAELLSQLTPMKENEPNVASGDIFPFKIE